MVELFLFIFGTTIGSFLNVVIDRLPKGQSIVYPFSHCPHCRHKLAWYDLLPLVSYILLGGKCRYCKAQISYYYPIIEIITGILFVLIYTFAIPLGVLYALYLLVMTSIWIIIFFTDYKYEIIPVCYIIIGSLVVIAYSTYVYSIPQLVNQALSAIGAFLFFFILFAATKGRGMGFGDVMLVLLLGLFLGFPNIALALYVSFLTGALISLFLILTGIKKLKHDTIPFGPFLIIGTFTALIWGNMITHYISKFLFIGSL